MKQSGEEKHQKQLKKDRSKKVLAGMCSIVALVAVTLMGAEIYKNSRADASDIHSEKQNSSESQPTKAALPSETSKPSKEPKTEYVAKRITEESNMAQEARAADPREAVLDHYKNLGVVKQTANFLNVRDMPTMDGMIIGKLPRYGGMSILEDTKDGWYHIQSGEVDGYVSDEFVATGKEAETLAIKYCKQMLQIAMEYVDVHRLPDSDSERWTRLQQNEKYIVKEKKEGWYRLDFNSEDAYVPADCGEIGYYLSEAEAFSSLENCSEPRRKLIEFGMQYLGVPYVWGGTDFSTGVDCSGFTLLCFLHIGIELPRVSYLQVNVGTPITLEEAKPGDLLFYADANQVVNHVAIYIGEGKILQSANSLHQVTISRYNYNTEPVAIKNIIGD